MATKTETSDGKKGGLLQGETHENGGIKAVVVTDNNRPVELEENEVIITAPAVKKHWKTLDKINRDGGGVPIGPPQMKKGGDIKTNEPFKNDKNENNKKTTVKEKEIIKACISYITTGTGTAEEISSNRLKDIESQLAFKFADANKLWIENMDSLPTPISGGGNENSLYYDKGAGIIYKSNNLSNHGFSILNYLNYILIHNELFPSTQYELHGFIGFSKGFDKNKDAVPYVEPVIYQKYIIGNPASQEDIEIYMESEKFKKIDDSTYEKGKYLISDLRPRNVVKGDDGNIYVIDNIIKIKIASSQMESGGSINPCLPIIKSSNSILNATGYYYTVDGITIISYNSGGRKNMNIFYAHSPILVRNELVKLFPPISQDEANGMVMKFAENAIKWENSIDKIDGDVMMLDQTMLICHYRSPSSTEELKTGGKIKPTTMKTKEKKQAIEMEKEHLPTLQKAAAGKITPKQAVVEIVETHDNKLSPRAELILNQSLEQYKKSDEKQKLKNIIIEQLQRNEQGENIGFELDKDMVAAGKEFLKRISNDMIPSDITSVALQDVISLERYRNLDLAEAKILFKIKEKSLNDDTSWSFGDPTNQREAIYSSLYDMGYITIGGENNEYELSQEGNDFVKAVKARIETIKGVQAGTDLFPEEANIDLHKPEKIYVDIKSCLVDEGDEESTFLFEGKEFINKETGHNERWKIISFFKYGVNLQHVTMNKLTTKKANEKLTFDEIKQFQKDGLIEIQGIDNETQLSHCLKILKKCIDNIDLKESHEAEKKAHEKTKIDNIKISTPPVLVGVKPLTIGDEGMWRGGVRRIVDIDELGNALLQEVGVDKPPIKISLEQLQKEFVLFPEESPYEITNAINTLEMLLNIDPTNQEWRKSLEDLKGEPIKMEFGGPIMSETDKDIFESQFGKQ